MIAVALWLVEMINIRPLFTPTGISLANSSSDFSNTLAIEESISHDPKAFWREISWRRGSVRDSGSKSQININSDENRQQDKQKWILQKWYVENIHQTIDSIKDCTLDIKPAFVIQHSTAFHVKRLCYMIKCKYKNKSESIHTITIQRQYLDTHILLHGHTCKCKTHNVFKNSFCPWLVFSALLNQYNSASTNTLRQTNVLSKARPWKWIRWANLWYVWSVLQKRGDNTTTGWTLTTIHCNPSTHRSHWGHFTHRSHWGHFGHSGPWGHWSHWTAHGYRSTWDHWQNRNQMWTEEPVSYYLQHSNTVGSEDTQA